MNNTLQEMTQDIQVRIRELAYLMWESAGRQQGMAMEYWLKAESEVLSTLQAAAARMMPGFASQTQEKSTKPVAAPEPSLAAPEQSPAASPKKADAELREAAVADKPAPRKPASRAKKA
jgi:hypothetical protein